MKKRILSFALVFSILLSLIVALPITASAASSGTCGDNLIWTLDDNGILTISGTGNMYSWSYDDKAPWCNLRGSIKSVKISDGVTSISNMAFSNCVSLTSIAIPDSVTSIGIGAFHYCTSLTSITIPDSVTSIGGNAFWNCVSLTSITIPDSVMSIGVGAFMDCYNLTSITIPDGVTSIGDSAFHYCTSLTSITIPDSVMSIGVGAFLYCTRLTDINVSSLNREYSSKDGVLFNKNKTTLICYPAGKREASYSIPDSVTSIGERAFCDCSSLTSITIGNSVTSIGNYAFSDCSSLTSITIGNSVTSIGKCAFYACSSLTSITIGNSVTSIGNAAFSGCSSLTSITIPDSVTSIGSYAFWGCSSLTDVYYGGSENEWNAISIGIYNNYLINATIHYNYEYSEVIEYLPPSSITGTFNFASGKKRNAEFSYDDNFFAENSYKYNHNLARFSMRLALSAFAKKTGSGNDKDYTKQYINAMNLLDTCKFKDIQWNADYEEKPRANGIGLIAGNKRIKYASGDYTLIALAIRGGGYEAEWGGNFTVGNDKHHKGFETARNYAIQFIQDYIASNEITGNVKILITGFSRAAATANLTAAYFDEYPERLSDNVSVKISDIFAYCFETPAGVLYPENDSGLYNNIYSIVNQHDPVPMVAMREWDFDRYGRTLYLPAAQTNSNYFELREKMIELYDEYIGNNKADISNDDKKPYKIDNFSKYTYLSTITYKYALENAQGVYLEQIVDKLAKSIGNPSNYKANYEKAFVYLGANLIGGDNGDEFINSLLYEFSWRYGAKKLTGYAGSLVPYRYIVRESLVAAFDDVGITMDSDKTDVIIDLIVSLGVDDFVTILKNCSNFGQAHYPELCMAWLDAIEGEEDFTDARLRTLYVNCPVDVEVYDSNSNLFAAIYGNVPQQIDGSTIIAYVDDNGQKVIYLPRDEEYRVEVLATDEGEVTYTVQEQNVSTGETKVINYNNMTVSKDDTLTGTIENLTTTESPTYLLASNTVKVSEAEVIENAEPIEITTLVEGNGVVDNGGNYYKGEYVQVTAKPFENEEFLGWYNGTELVSVETAYRFQVAEEVNLTAKFTENTCAVTLADSNDNIIDIIRVVKGNAVTLEKVPEKESYTFGGLYKDNTLETSLAVEDVFYEDTTLYVKWIKNIDITSAVYTNDTVVVNATMVDKLVEKSGIVLIALYYDNILVGLEKLAPNKDIGYTFENIKAKEDDYIVKIMYLDSMTKLIPLNDCEVATVQQ